MSKYIEYRNIYSCRYHARQPAGRGGGLARILLELELELELYASVVQAHCIMKLDELVPLQVYRICMHDD